MLKPNTKVIINKEEPALIAYSNFSSFLPSGNFEKAKNKATAAQTAATIKYSVLIFVTVTSVFALPTDPNKKKLTIMGPSVVPSELMPPAKFNLCEPVEGSPNVMANGCADVCCRENPNATIKNDPKIAGKELALAEGIINKAPTTEMPKP